MSLVCCHDFFCPSLLPLPAGHRFGAGTDPVDIGQHLHLAAYPQAFFALESRPGMRRPTFLFFVFVAPFLYEFHIFEVWNGFFCCPFN